MSVVDCGMCDLEETCECKGHNMRAARPRPDQIIIGLFIFGLLTIILAFDDLFHKVFKTGG